MSLSSNNPAAACPVGLASSAPKGQEQGPDLAAVARSADPGSPRSLRCFLPAGGVEGDEQGHGQDCPARDERVWSRSSEESASTRPL